jgi:hypothetical protein
VQDGLSPYCGVGPIVNISGATVALVDGVTQQPLDPPSDTTTQVGSGCFSLSIPAGGLTGLALMISYPGYFDEYVVNLDDYDNVRLQNAFALLMWPLEFVWNCSPPYGVALPFPYFPLGVAAAPGEGEIVGAVYFRANGQPVGGAEVATVPWNAAGEAVFYTDESGVPLAPDEQSGQYVSTCPGVGFFWLLNGLPGVNEIYATVGGVSTPHYSTIIVANSITMGLIPVDAPDDDDDTMMTTAANREE